MAGFSLKHPASVAAPMAERSHEIVARADSLRGVRLAYVADIGGTGIDPEVARVCRDAARALERDGATVEEIQADFSDGVQAFITLRGESMVGNHLDRLDKLDRLNPNLAGNIRLGLDVKILDIARAERKRMEIFHRWRALFERYDLVLTPCSPVPPFPVDQNYPTEIAGKKLDNYIAWIAQTFLVSLATLPAASAPAGLTAARLPVGLQIVGPRFSEPKLLTCAKFVERVSPAGWAPGTPRKGGEGAPGARRHEPLERRLVRLGIDARRVAVRRRLDEQQGLSAGRAQIELHSHRVRHDRVALAVDDQERNVQAPDLRRGVEAVADQPVDRVERGDPRVAQQLAHRSRRAFDGHAAHVGVARGELERGRRAERMAVHEPAAGIGLVPPQLLPRRFRVLVHGRLRGPRAVAPAEAAVVDHEHRGAGGVHRGRELHHSRLGAPGSGQYEHRWSVPAVRQPPAVHERAVGAGAQPHLAGLDAEHPRRVLGLGPWESR